MPTLIQQSDCAILSNATAFLNQESPGCRPGDVARVTPKVEEVPAVGARIAACVQVAQLSLEMPGSKSRLSRTVPSV